MILFILVFIKENLFVVFDLFQASISKSGSLTTSGGASGVSVTFIPIRISLILEEVDAIFNY